MKKSAILIAVSLVLPMLLAFNVSALFIGITDGFVKDNTGSFVPGANVSVTVTGCSGGSANGCVGSALAGSNGYYIVNNLNLPKNGGVTVNAVNGTGSGSAGGTADNFQVAHVNVTICFPPSLPSLTDVPDGDEPNVTFSWTSGTDPKSQPTTDDFRLDGSVTSPATSPQARTGLSFTSHTWDARTCNGMCCSSWASDSFTLTCPSPSAPGITDVLDSHNTTVTFTWTSGTDPHGRSIYDEFYLDGGVTSPATSPQTRVGLGFALHTWRARTCNVYCCSSWTSDTFTTGNQAPSAPNRTNHTVYDTITELNWTSGIDPESDPTYDEFQYQNGSIVSLVTAPYNVTTELLVRWAVRTCDNFGACSNWTWTDSVTCGNITTCSCPTCPTSSGGGGGGGWGADGVKWTGGGVGCRKVAMTCNGISIGEDLLLSLDLQLGPNGKKITISGLNITLENLEYCPWCYNGERDYDETGIDCGGSCRGCSEAEVPLRKEGTSWLAKVLIIIIAIAIIALSAWASYKYKHRKKAKSRR